MKFKPHTLPPNSLPQMPFQVFFAPAGQLYIAYMVKRPDGGNRLNLNQIIVEELEIELTALEKVQEELGVKDVVLKTRRDR